MKSLLTPEVAGQIKEVLNIMENEIKVVLFTSNDCDTCAPTLQLLEEVTVLSDKITLEERSLTDDVEEAKAYGVTLAPTFVILDKDNNFRNFRFNGIPA